MGKILQMLEQDIRFREGLTACMNCGICTAICPAAAVFPYDPRQICQIVQSGDETALDKLLCEDDIWYCGQCMSCRTRCPRGNTPGYIITALRRVSILTGKYLNSEQGRKQQRIAQNVGLNLLTNGYCIDADLVHPLAHLEQGPVWEWIYENREQAYEKCGANYKKSGAGALRAMDETTMKEFRSIFDVTGGSDYIKKIAEGE
ncbi:hypothetical protein DMA11_10890 [Marinilabiliaceae bacterium JC017]|nr:hypothetical protein DMA11_10890 [Marinilabiliaceae bacterium JC017]